MQIDSDHDFKKFKHKINKTFQLLFIWIGQEIQKQLMLEERIYPGTTIRQYGRGTTGKIADSPRDTIDSKNLYNSFDFKLIRTISSLSGEYSYDIHYAALIYFGYLSSRGYIVPPYPWIEIAIDKLDLEAKFKEIWNSF